MSRRYKFEAKFTYADEPHPISAPTYDALDDRLLQEKLRQAIAEKDYTSIDIKITVTK
jgi:hypothetical protein